MMIKILIQMVILCAISIVPLNAASISILVIEAGLPTASPASNKSIMWENGLMDVLFESGHIVTNASIFRTPDIPDEEFPFVAERDFDDAKEGGMRFFIVAIVSHPSPHNVTLRMFSTESRELLIEYTYNDTVHVSERAEFESIKNSIRTFASRIR